MIATVICYEFESPEGQSFANVEVVRRCLLANMGVGLLPLCVVEDDLKDGSLPQLDIEGAPYQFFSALVYPKERKLKAFLGSIESV